MNFRKINIRKLAKTFNTDKQLSRVQSSEKTEIKWLEMYEKDRPAYAQQRPTREHQSVCKHLRQPNLLNFSLKRLEVSSFLYKKNRRTRVQDKKASLWHLHFDLCSFFLYLGLANYNSHVFYRYNLLLRIQSEHLHTALEHGPEVCLLILPSTAWAVFILLFPGLLAIMPATEGASSCHISDYVYSLLRVTMTWSRRIFIESMSHFSPIFDKEMAVSSVLETQNGFTEYGLENRFYNCGILLLGLLMSL